MNFNLTHPYYSNLLNKEVYSTSTSYTAQRSGYPFSPFLIIDWLLFLLLLFVFCINETIYLLIIIIFYFIINLLIIIIGTL